MKKKMIISTVALAGILVFNGCASKGSLATPIKPPSSKSKNYRSMATVKFYKSSDIGGTLRFESRVVIDLGKTKNHTTHNPKYQMVADSKHYMIKRLKPGVHTFSASAVGNGKQIAHLKAGRTYYLSATFSGYGLGIAAGGIPSLAFKSKQDFIKETKGDKQIRMTGECDTWNGCKYKVVR